MRAGYFSPASFRPLSTFARIVAVAVWYFPSSSASWASRFAARSASVFFARDSRSTRSCFAFASICFAWRPLRTLIHSAAGARSRLPRRTSRSIAVHSSRAFWAASFLRPPKIVFEASSAKSSFVRPIAPSWAPLSSVRSPSPSGTGLSSAAAAPAFTPHLVRNSFAFAAASSSWLPHSRCSFSHRARSFDGSFRFSLKTSLTEPCSNSLSSRIFVDCSSQARLKAEAFVFRCSSIFCCSAAPCDSRRLSTASYSFFTASISPRCFAVVAPIPSCASEVAAAISRSRSAMISFSRRARVAAAARRRSI